MIFLAGSHFLCFNLCLSVLKDIETTRVNKSLNLYAKEMIVVFSVLLLTAQFWSGFSVWIPSSVEIWDFQQRPISDRSLWCSVGHHLSCWSWALSFLQWSLLTFCQGNPPKWPLHPVLPLFPNKKMKIVLWKPGHVIKNHLILMIKLFDTSRVTMCCRINIYPLAWALVRSRLKP